MINTHQVTIVFIGRVFRLCMEGIFQEYSLQLFEAAAFDGMRLH